MNACGRSALVVILAIVSFTLVLGAVDDLTTGTSLTVLSQEGRYVGYSIEDYRRWPWQPDTRYIELGIPAPDDGVWLEFPPGNFTVTHEIKGLTYPFGGPAGEEPSR